MISSPNTPYNWSNIHSELKKDTQIWELFTKKEEYTPKKIDKYDRATFKNSRHTDIQTPIVSEYLIKKEFHPEYQDDKRFAIFLSHDIDDINISSWHLIRSLIPVPSHRDLFGWKKLFLAYLKKQNPYINFQKIIQIEKKYEAASSFFFLATEKDIFGYKYQLQDIQDELVPILENECEIGLHTGFYAFNDTEKIIHEKKKIEEITGEKVVGVRNHLFRFITPLSWKRLAQAGFQYDTSFGYYDMIGFRNGMCHPFQPYDLIENKKINILEIPPCIVDISMFSYMKIDASSAWNYIKRLIDTVEKLEGVLTILWHNWTFSFPVSYAGLFGKEWTKLYEKILEYGYKKNAWLTNGKALTTCFLKN
jgi:hypothetical protein